MAFWAFYFFAVGAASAFLQASEQRDTTRFIAWMIVGGVAALLAFAAAALSAFRREDA